jgi:sialate O-acetylesterase
MNRITLRLFAFLLLSGALQADFFLPQVLSDGMVLQRGKPLLIWGKGVEGKEVKVWFNGQDGKTTVKNGVWSVTFDPYEAGGPFDLTIKSGEKTKIIQNVLIGEVWIAGGQSNMQWSLSGSIHKEQALAMKGNDRIRVFKQTRHSTASPQFDTLPAKWMPSTPANRKHWSAVAYWFASDIQKRLGVPVGLLINCDGGTRAQYWTPLKTFRETGGLESYSEEASMAKRTFESRRIRYEHQLATFMNKRKKGVKTGPAPTYYGRVPSGYYNAMIHPIRKFSSRGVIWYQGERNALTTREAIEYRQFFPLMIGSWRDAFGDPNLPFLFVQLPRMSDRNLRDLPALRESQLHTVSNVPHTGMVVTTDVGKEVGLHPQLKKPIGLRLAKLARAQVYGEKISFVGPRFKEFSVEKAELTIRFDNLSSSLKTSDGKPPTEFTICGSDKKFHPAQAQIMEDTIVLSSKEVSQPVAVRYCWRNECFPNLFSKNGLPVEPFRTDTFDLPEKNPK